MTTKTAVRRLADGTLATELPVYSQPYTTRVAIGSAFVEKTVELVLRAQYGNPPTVIVCDVVTAAVADGGTTRDVIVVKSDDDLVPVAYSGARVQSITELTMSEYLKRQQS